MYKHMNLYGMRERRERKKIVSLYVGPWFTHICVWCGGRLKKIIIIIYSLGIVGSFENLFHDRVHSNEVILFGFIFLVILFHVNKKNRIEC